MTDHYDADEKRSQYSTMLPMGCISKQCSETKSKHRIETCRISVATSRHQAESAKALHFLSLVHLFTESITINVSSPFNHIQALLHPKENQNYASTPKLSPNTDQVDLDCTKSSNLCSSPLPNPSLDHSPSPDGTNPNPALGPDPASQLALWSIWGTLDVLSDGDSGLEEGIAGDLVMFGLTVPGRWSGES